MLDNDVFVIEHTLPPHNDVFTAPAVFYHYEGWRVFKSKGFLDAQLRIAAVLLRKTGRSRPLFANDRELPFPYYDDTIFGWSKTFLALYNQFSDPNREYFYMMRIELYIIGRFIETRQSTGIISAQDLKKIEQIIQEYSNTKDKEFYQLILQAYQSVKEIYERYHI